MMVRDVHVKDDRPTVQDLVEMISLVPRGSWVRLTALELIKRGHLLSAYEVLRAEYDRTVN